MEFAQFASSQKEGRGKVIQGPVGYHPLGVGEENPAKTITDTANLSNFAGLLLFFFFVFLQLAD